MQSGEIWPKSTFTSSASIERTIEREREREREMGEERRNKIQYGTVGRRVGKWI